MLGLVTLGITRIYPRRTVDPIEANALFGGRMSMNGSLVVVLQTIISNGVGASIGLEAAYTQIGSAIASRCGHAFRVRRNDMRLLVGCGAAAAIAGAFNAPLTGSFYAFELVIGTYTLATFAPVAVAALVSLAVVQALGGSFFELTRRFRSHIDPLDYIPILALGMLCALLGIAIMRGVTLTEELFRRAGCRLVAPGDRRTRGRDAGAGHAGGAVVRPRRDRRGVRGARSAALVVLLVVLKAMASAISIGSGFRGGLFFASLFLGALLGKAFAGALALVSTAARGPTGLSALWSA